MSDGEAKAGSRQTIHGLGATRGRYGLVFDTGEPAGDSWDLPDIVGGAGGRHDGGETL